MFRFSPKASTYQEREEKAPRTPIMRMGRKPAAKNVRKSQDVLTLVSAHKEAVNNTEFNDSTSKTASPSIFKLASTRGSPCIRQGKSKNKMKKLPPKKMGKPQQDFSWFESDKNFAFTE